MPNYAVANTTAGGAGVAQNACTATYQAGLVVCASSSPLSPPVYPKLARGKIYDILVGAPGTPADSYVEYSGGRATTGTTVVWLGSVSSISSAYPLDLADPGFSALVIMNTSAQTNSAFSNELFYVGVNQRASYRWVAAPGSEFLYPANTSASINSFSLRYRGTATTSISLNTMFTE